MISGSRRGCLRGSSKNCEQGKPFRRGLLASAGRWQEAGKVIPMQKNKGEVAKESQLSLLLSPIFLRTSERLGVIKVLGNCQDFCIDGRRRF